MDYSTNVSFSHSKLSRRWYAIECSLEQFTGWGFFFFLQTMKSSIQLLVIHNFITQHNSIWHTYSIELSPSWEANWFPGSQEISLILWNLKVHYHIQKYPPSVPILGFSVKISYRDIFLQWGAVINSLNLHAGGAPLSEICDGLFNIFTATLHIGGCSSIHKVRMRHAF